MLLAILFWLKQDNKLTAAFGIETPLSVMFPTALQIGSVAEIMYIDCSMRYEVEEYISAHSLTTIGSLIQSSENYYNRSVFFGFGAMLIHPAFDNLFDKETRSFYLDLCKEDHMGVSLMRYVFPYGLPYEFYEGDEDEGMREIFENSEEISDDIIREFVL